MARRGGDDPYVYPGTEVLRNKLGLRDSATLRLVEYAYTADRATNAPSFEMSTAGYRASHKHLFNDLYDWAGKMRTVVLTKNEDTFAMPMAVESSLAQRFRALDKEQALRGSSREEFARGAAHHIAELNAIHPFREGNGRTMRLHLQQLGEQARHEVDVERINPREWMNASIRSFRIVDEEPMQRLILNAATPERSLDAKDGRRSGPEAQLSGDGRILYEALSEKVGREMTKLSPSEAGSVREEIAKQLLRKEASEGPVVLSEAQRRLARSSPNETLRPPLDKGRRPKR